MFFNDNSEKYYSLNSPLLIDPSFIESIDNINSEQKDENTIFIKLDKTSYIQPKLKLGKSNSSKNSSESNRNDSTNAATKSVKDRTIIQISKIQKIQTNQIP